MELTFKPTFSKKVKINKKYYDLMYNKILYYLNIHFSQSCLDSPFPYNLSKMLYSIDIYKSYIPCTEYDNNNKCEKKSQEKIINARIYEHQRIRKLLNLYNNNKDVNRVFPYDLACRMYNISNEMLLECKLYDTKYNYEREYLNKIKKEYLDNYDNFIDLEERDCSVINFYKTIPEKKLIAPREYVLDKCLIYDHIYEYKNQVNYNNDIYKDIKIDYGEFYDFTKEEI